MHTIVELHRRSVASARTVIDRLTLDDLDRPTPCGDWVLRDLLEHMAGQDHGFAAALTAARDGADIDLASFHPRPLGAAPATTLATGLDDVVTAFVGADESDLSVLMPEFGSRVPAPVLVSMHLVDTLVHGWDVAAAVGVADCYVAGLDEEAVVAGLSAVEQVPTDEESRSAPGAPFGPVLAAPDTADAWTRTLTLLGRDPAWAGRAA